MPQLHPRTSQSTGSAGPAAAHRWTDAWRTLPCLRWDPNQSETRQALWVFPNSAYSALLIHSISAGRDGVLVVGTLRSGHQHHHNQDENRSGRPHSSSKLSRPHRPPACRPPASTFGVLLLALHMGTPNGEVCHAPPVVGPAEGVPPVSGHEGDQGALCDAAQDCGARGG
ncbi:hypothetical protein BC835DRAFT_191021 [Cytidiella melzeri]|nr:hypothetical protein BC835DRAFT_191021 [Cytidiella melzeri]